MFSKIEWLSQHPEWTEQTKIDEITESPEITKFITKDKEVAFVGKDGFYISISKAANFIDLSVVIKMSVMEVEEAKYKYELREKTAEELLSELINSMLTSRKPLKEIRGACFKMVEMEPGLNKDMIKRVYFAFPETEENRLRIEGFIKDAYHPGMVPVVPHKMKVEENLYIRLSLLENCDVISLHFNWKDDSICSALAEHAINHGIKVIYQIEEVS